MNKTQKEIIKELRKIAKKLNKSPGRREITYRLYSQCTKQFGSFNNAKLKAGLTIFKRICDPIPKKYLKLDKELTRIVSHLTFDGHLYGTLRAFQFNSNNKKELEDLKKDVQKKFRINVHKIYKGNGYGEKVLRYTYFNRNLCKFLYSIGTPKGNKVLTKFDIPKWIKNNKEFAREYLKIAYLCEGCKWKVSKNTEAIQINLNKEENLLDDGLKFMNSLKKLLKKFDIETNKTVITKSNKRKDEKITNMIRFYIKANSFNKFIKEIGWYK